MGLARLRKSFRIVNHPRPAGDDRTRPADPAGRAEDLPEMALTVSLINNK